MNYQNIREGEVKNKITQEFFTEYDCTKVLGDVDFAVSPKEGIFKDEIFYLWAEAKQKPTDVLVMLTQLVITVGKAKLDQKFTPPAFLGAFDNEKIAFVPYKDVHEVFYQNDFNWKAAPNDHTSKEFQQVYNQVDKVINHSLPFNTFLFYFKKDEKELRKFIKENFIVGKTETAKIEITEYNFVHIFYKWLETVKPTIAVKWEGEAYEYGIFERDFYLADLISENDETIEKLLVQLKKTYYKTEVNINKKFFQEIEFTDSGAAYRIFWNKYRRPPKDIYRQEIKNRQDLLVLPNFRERKGAFFTPQIWVEKSQEYIADVLGEKWQDEYYIWDCAAGTGNLLYGLTNPLHIFASTLDSGDVKIMHQDIDNQHSKLLKNHVFQFDFLNGDFSELPQNLQNIIKDEKRRKKLIIYINPPYVEADNRKGEGRKGVAESKIQNKYSELMGYTKREIYIQFLTRIYQEISGCKIGEFSTLKLLQAPRFSDFRKFFKAKLKKCFLIPANSFDNVKGQFPIGFKIWDTDDKVDFKQINVEVFNSENIHICNKKIWNYDNKKLINDWVKTFRKTNLLSIATIIGVGSDFQNQRLVRFGEPNMKVPADNHNWQISINNFIQSCVYFAVRKVIPATWLNDRDQFLFPNKKWEKDIEFQNDCLVFTIFNNNISAKNGVNHWIPFKETEIGVQSEYESHTLISFLSGEKVANAYSDLFSHLKDKTEKQSGLNWQQGQKREFSAEAQEVFDAGKALWKYYHGQDMKFFEFKFNREKYNPNASLYDIKGYFKCFSKDKQGKERMNNKSTDPEFNMLEKKLSQALNILAKKIEPKVYEYEFLLK